jgi:hypothetical protein
MVNFEGYGLVMGKVFNDIIIVVEMFLVGSVVEYVNISFLADNGA